MSESSARRAQEYPAVTGRDIAALQDPRPMIHHRRVRPKRRNLLRHRHLGHAPLP